MASNRIGRINEEIQRELSSLFRTLKDPRVQGGMVTITHVDTTTDLRYCRVFVSVLDKTQEKDVIRGLKSAAGYLRRELGMAMSLRYTPELQFTTIPSSTARTFWKCCATRRRSSPRTPQTSILYWTVRKNDGQGGRRLSARA